MLVFIITLIVTSFIVGIFRYYIVDKKNEKIFNDNAEVVLGLITRSYIKYKKNEANISSIILDISYTYNNALYSNRLYVKDRVDLENWKVNSLVKLKVYNQTIKLDCNNSTPSRNYYNQWGSYKFESLYRIRHKTIDSFNYLVKDEIFNYDFIFIEYSCNISNFGVKGSKIIKFIDIHQLNNDLRVKLRERNNYKFLIVFDDKIISQELYKFISSFVYDSAYIDVIIKRIIVNDEIIML